MPTLTLYVEADRELVKMKGRTRVDCLTYQYITTWVVNQLHLNKKTESKRMSLLKLYTDKKCESNILRGGIRNGYPR